LGEFGFGGIWKNLVLYDGGKEGSMGKWRARSGAGRGGEGRRFSSCGNGAGRALPARKTRRKRMRKIECQSLKRPRGALRRREEMAERIGS